MFKTNINFTVVLFLSRTCKFTVFKCTKFCLLLQNQLNVDYDDPVSIKLFSPRCIELVKLSSFETHGVGAG